MERERCIRYVAVENLFCYILQKSSHHRCPDQYGTLIILGFATIVAIVVAVLSSRNCDAKNKYAHFSLPKVDFTVKPEHLVLLRGFFCFVSLCQLVMSINVMHPEAQ